MQAAFRSGRRGWFEFSIGEQGGLTFYVDPGGWPSGWYGAAVANMQTVVNEYNAYGDFTANNGGSIYVYYNAGIPTEQASYGGWGGSVGVGNTYPNVRVLLHESSHWLGTGTYSAYWSGPAASAMMQEFDGIGNLLSGDGQHYWPYGENYDNESSPINDARHIAMVYALRQDFGIGSTAPPSSATSVTMTANDTAGQSGFNFPWNWSDGHFPQASTNYSTGNYLMLSPLDENSGGATPSFNFGGGSLTINNTNGNKGGLQFQGTGTTSILGFNNLILNGGYIGATNGNGNLLQLGGKITLASTGTIDAAQGNINILATITGTGGVNITGSGHIITLTGANTFTGGINISSGATLYANAPNGANNKALSYAGSINVNSGGTLESSQNALFGSDGTTERPITVNAGATLIADAGADVGVGTVTLNGGTLTTGGASPAYGSWRFDNATDRLLVTDNSIVSAVNVKFGNSLAAINVSSGKTLSFTGTITDATSGGISYLNVIGAGTVSLGNTSTYTGTTSIQGGKLLLGGSGSINNTSSIAITGGKLVQDSSIALSRPVTISGSGTLDGTGTASSSVSVNSGGYIANGDGATSALTVGSLAFNSGGGATASIPGNSLPISPGIKVSGALSTDNNAAGQITLSVNAPGASLTAGVYDLIKYGSFTATTADFKLGTIIGMSTRQSASIVTDPINSALAISVTGTAGNLTWRGTNTSNWSTGSTGNWLNGATADDFYNGDKVTFDDTVGTGPTTINVDPGGVIVGSVTFANSSAKPYTLTGGMLNGAGGAVMAITNGGTVNLNTTYTGNINITSGTLLVGSGGTIGGLGGLSSITNNGTVSFNRSNTAIQGTDFGTISGTGTLIQKGVGTLILANANTYTGATNISAGTLQIGNGGTTGSLAVTSAIINNGTLIFNRSNTATQGTDFGTISGAGPVIQNGVGATVLSSANSYTGGTTLNAGTMVAANNSAFSTGLIKFNGGALGSSTTVTLANNLNVSGNSVIGWASQSGDITLNGTMTGNATLSNYLGSSNNYNVYFKGNLSGFTGTLNYTCDANAATGWWRFGSNGTTTDLSNASLVINVGNVTNLTTVSKNAGFSDGISGSTLKLGSLSGDGVFQSSFNNAGPNALQVGFLNTSSGFTGVIAGGNAGTNMSLTKVGTGTLTLGGANLYTGGTNVQGGTLLLTNTSGAADTGKFNLSGGTTLQVNIGSNANFGYNPTINLLGNATISNGAAGGVGSGAGQINFTGTLTGNGNALNISSPALARWYMNATVSSVSQINIVSGAMGFDVSVGNHGGSAPVNVSNGAALWIANSVNTLTNSLTLNGSGIDGLGALYQEGGANPIVNGPITLAGNTSIGGDTAGATVVLNGVLSGPGMALTMVGYNSYALAAAETYTGPTTITSGTLQLGNGGTTGSISPTIAVVDNGTFAFNRSNTLTQGTDFGTINGTGGVFVAGSGLVSLTAANSYTGTTFVQNGTLNVSGGIASPSNDVATGYGAGSGSLNVVSGGSIQGNEVWFGESAGAASPVTGVGNIYTGGTISASAWVDVGRSGVAGSSGTLNLDGGIVNVKTTAASGNLEVGAFGTASGTVNINSGAVNLQNNANILLGSAGTSGNGTINQLGGTVTFYSNGGTTVGGTGVLTLGASTSSGVYTYNLAGGTLTVPSINRTTSSTTAQGIFNFNGGTLRPTASNTNFMTGLTAANVLTGGAKIDTNGFNVTIGQQLAGTSGDGGLTKLGAGVVTLTSAETYTGGTTINAGTLPLAPLPLTAVADYTFDHVSGSTVLNDGTGGSSMNGTLSGATIVSGGQTGNAVSFNGNASVNINNGVTNLSNTAIWTVNAWVKTSTAGASILSKDNTGSDWGNGNTVFYLGDGTGPGSGAIPSAVRYAGGFFQGAGTATAVTDNTWHQVTYVNNAGAYSLYVDGVAQALSSGNSGFSNADVGSIIRLGWSIDTIGGDGAVNFNGLLDNVQIYNQALSASQVQSLAQGAGFGTLPSTTNVSIATGATMDITGTNQQIASLNGAAGSFVTLGSGTLGLNTSGGKAFSGVISGTGSIVMTGTGTQSLSGNDTYTGTTTVTRGTLNLGANQNSSGILVRNSSGISITNGELVAGSAASRANRDLLVIGGSGLSISSGKLDLGTNDLDLQNGGAAGLTNITNQIRQGFSNGPWSGNGIISSPAAADSTHLTTLGVILNNQSGSALFNSTNRFDGITPNAGDVLVKYTYFGDATLDGEVDGSDYTRIDNGYLSNLSGWFNGDFNYDNVINGSDYTLIDNAFNTQGAQLTSQVATITAQIASVPEPGFEFMPLLATLGLLRRRQSLRVPVRQRLNI